MLVKSFTYLTNNKTVLEQQKQIVSCIDNCQKKRDKIHLLHQKLFVEMTNTATTDTV